MQAYQIPSFQIDEPEAAGLYMQADELNQDMADALAALEELDVALVPNMPGFIMKGRRLRDGLEFTIAKVSNDPNGETKEIKVSTTLFALREADAPIVAAAALAHLPTSAVPPHPQWEESMQGVPSAPFTAIVPHRDLLTGAHEGHITMDEVNACTGFAQFFVGHILAGAEIGTIVDLAEIVADEGELSGQELAIAIQTGGVPGNVLIVEPGEDEYPQIYAYIGDAELDAVRVDFNIDETLTIDTEGMKYLTFDSETLDLLENLRAEAADIWVEVCELLDELEEEVLAAEDDGEEIEVEDPLTHLYTKHAPVEIAEDTVATIKAHLGLAQRYNAA